VHKAELIAVIKQRSYRRGRFKLASGAESEFYFNLKPTMMDPAGAYYVARELLSLIYPTRADYVGGLEMGAVPLLGAIAALSFTDRQPVKTFFVRKKAKDHGTQVLVEGLMMDETLADKRVGIIDDVATSGGSIVKAAEAARAAGAIVDTGVVIIDREEGGTEGLAAAGMRLLSVLKKSDFL